MKLQPKAVFVIHSGWAFHARRAGVDFRRTPAFNDAPDFIDLLADLAVSAGP